MRQRQTGEAAIPPSATSKRDLPGKGNPPGKRDIPGKGSFMIAAGNFFFRWRDMLGSIVVLLTILLAFAPIPLLRIFWLDTILMAVGLLVVALGSAVRMVTIGYAYIKRGGLNRRIYVDTLTRSGVYAHTRNPMYLGNLAIATGLALFANFIHFYIILPFFYFMYAAIIIAEENYLLQKIGSQYSDYAKNVARLFPSRLGQWRETVSAMRFDWRRVLRKEKGTLYGLSMVLLAVVAVKLYLLYGIPWSSKGMISIAALALFLSLLYAIVYILTAKGKLNSRA